MSATIIPFPGFGDAEPSSALGRGRLLAYSDMANPRKLFIVTGEPCAGGYCADGLDVISETGRRTRVFPSSIGRTGWEDTGKNVPLGEVEDWIKNARAEGERLKREEAEAAEVAKAEAAKERERLLADYPDLLRVEGSGKSGRIVATNNIRKLLKAKFPGFKFSVTSSTFSGGDAIDVRWTDGPTSEAVRAIIDRFSAGSFDGMTDLYSYESTAWTELFGDAKYVNGHRNISDEAALAVAAELGVNLRIEWGWTGFRDREEEENFRRTIYARDFLANPIKPAVPAPAVAPAAEPLPVAAWMPLGAYVFAI